MSKKTRLDVLLTERGLCESRQKAQATIMAGLVFVDGQRSDKPGTPVAEDASVEVRGHALRYVSRGGLKLEKAMQTFPITLEGKVCADIGASTGGFTDCMLQNGAAKVYAVDVGYGQLDWKLRSDERVVCLERTNARYLTREQIPEELDFASIDVSFISLKLIFPALYALLRGGVPHQAAVRGRTGKGGEKGRCPRPEGASGGTGKLPHACEGKRLYSAWYYLLSHSRAGGEYRVSGLFEEKRRGGSHPRSAGAGGRLTY